MAKYDVFLSYSSEDRLIISQLADELRQLGLRVWFDQWALAPGTRWMRNLYEGIDDSCATAICIGQGGLGNWQEEEMEHAVSQQVEGRHSVIPVFLPGVPAKAGKLSPMLRPYTWVVFEQALERKMIEHLYWGIKGEKYVADQPSRGTAQSPAAPSAIEDAIRNLRDRLNNENENITFFVGAATLPPSLCEITRGLLVEVDLIQNDYNHLLPPVDIAGLYYDVHSSPDATKLERKVISMIQAFSALPAAAARLAELISLLANRPKPRMPSRIQQLIVTTNLDLMIERALLQRGISFTRFVQHTSAPAIQVNQYRDVSLLADGSIQIGSGGDARKISRQDLGDLDGAIASFGRLNFANNSRDPNVKPLDALRTKELSSDGPILYKFRGSQDVRGSCAVSADQYMDYARMLVQLSFVPSEITGIVNSTPVLLLGYSFFDPDYRLIKRTLLPVANDLRRDPVYAVQVSPEQEPNDPYRRMELKLGWDKVKAKLVRDGITPVECSSEEFLRLLMGAPYPARVA